MSEEDGKSTKKSNLITKKDYISLYREKVDEAYSIFIERNRIYGAAFEIGGVLGVAAELIGIAGKLVTLVLRDYHAGSNNAARVRNAMVDAVNYGIIGMLMIDDENWKGRGLGNE